GPSQIVLYTQTALTGDRVNSYTPLAGMLPSGQVGGPHNCIQCGVTLQIQPGLFSNTGTPANGCFGGCNNGGGTTTTPGKKHHNGGGKNNGGGNGGKGHGNGGNGGGGIKHPGDCGTAGLSIVSN